MTLVGLHGDIGAGKDTVASYFVQHGFQKESFASPLKDVTSTIFGWPRALLEGDTVYSREWREAPSTWWAQQLGIPDFTPRLAMSVVGTDAFRNRVHKDIWVLAMERRLALIPDNVVVSDVRYQNEADMIRRLGGTVIEVLRPGFESHNTQKVTCDAHFCNSGSLETVKFFVSDYLNKIEPS